MKTLIGFVMAGVIVASSASVFAQGCCGASKAPAKCPAMADGKSGGEMFAKVNPTSEQKTKLDALQAECMKGKCDAAAKEKFLTGVKEILTPEQYAQWQAACQKAQKSGSCPQMKDQNKDTSKS